MFRKVLIITKSSVKKNVLQNASSEKSMEYLKQMNDVHYIQGLNLAERICKYFEVDVEPLEAVFDQTCREEYILRKLSKSDIDIERIDMRSSFKNEIANQTRKTRQTDPNEGKTTEPKKKVTNYDLIISLGGDGTFLSCSHLIHDNKQYLLGINSNSDSVGFLNSFKYPQFIDKADEICGRIQNKEFVTLKRKRFICDFRALNSDCTQILGLNDVFLGTENFGSSFRYDFTVDSEMYHNVKSTGVLLYTGTGSSAWANSLNHINEQKLALIFEYFEKTATPCAIASLQEFIKEHYYIASDSDFMGYLHRELFYTKKNMRYEGIGREFEVVNNTVNGFLAIDGFYYKLDIDASVRVRIAGEDKSLSCFKFEN